MKAINSLKSYWDTGELRSIAIGYPHKTKKGYLMWSDYGPYPAFRYYNKEGRVTHVSHWKDDVRVSPITKIG